MNTRGLLDQLLKSGQDMLQNKAGGSQNKASSGGLGGLLGGSGGSGGLGSLLSGAGGGALAAGAMGLLIGNKKVRKVGGKVAIYGVPTRPTATGRRSRARRLGANRKLWTEFRSPRSSNTVRRFSRRWWRQQRQMVMSMSANAR